MKKLIHEIVELNKAVNVYYPGLSDPEPGPPASDNDLLRLDTYFSQKNLSTPVSLRDALRVCNGAKHLYGEDFGLLSVDEIVSGAIEMVDEAIEEFPTATDIIIGGGSTGEFMGLDLSKKTHDGEIGVLSVTADLFARSAMSLVSYLETLHQTLTESLESERRDRDDATRQLGSDE